MRKLDVDPYTVKVEQPDLLDLRETRTGRFEFLTSVWNAAEALTSPDYETRCWGLDRLVEYDAIRQSPLIAFLIAAQLTEADLALRSRFVSALADVLGPTSPDQPVSEAVQNHLCGYLGGMRTRQVFSLLQVVEVNASAEPKVARLLKYCSYAGEHLADILADRQMPLPLRKLAAQFIGRIGYVDAIPALERLINRIETRNNGRFIVADGSSPESDESSLVPLMQNALAALRSP